MVRCLTAALLALGITWSARSADPVPVDDRDEARKAIVDLSSNLTAPDVAERAKKIVKEHDSCDISTIFTLGRRHGLGIGKLTELNIPDSVERLIIETSKRKTLS